MLIALSLASAAHAFCGTYVGKPGDQLINETSRVVLAHDDVYGQTTLTLDMDVAGASSDFGVVVPVPSGLDATSVRTVDRALIDSVMHWAGPRGVAYSCQDVEDRTRDIGCSTGGGGCANVDISLGSEDYLYAKVSTLPPTMDLGGSDLNTLAVTVEHQFAVAEYDLVILSAESGEDLEAWLSAEGFVMPDGAAELFEDYLRYDSWFVAARVRLDSPIHDGSWLSPLQFRYSDHSDTLTVPIRVGTLSGKGQQEVVVTTITNGSIPGISTFPEATVDRDCLLDDGTDLTAHYADAVDKAIDDVGGSGWILEHSWSLFVKCDPCPPPSQVSPFSEADLSALGLESALDTWGSGPRISRLRVRYQLDQVHTDLALYETGQHDNVQTRFIFGPPGIQPFFPVCGEGFVDPPAECPPPADVPKQGALPLFALLGPLGLVGLGLRRRS